ncbi:MAG TPA: catalase, partial [Anaerovoracaceae bacterium]|nr:catalase [Anaerovoracaceae bacterium]
FILADAIKFMDVTHAVKPNPITDIPQASVARDGFWDYVANNQESANMVMWLMSLRGRPRSWRMIDGWPINTFRLINAEGKSTFVRFVWKAKLGVHSLLLEEANVIGGIDPDFHRRDIVEAVEKCAYPEYDLGVQLIPEEDEFKYEFDLLDATKMWPEEVVPVEIIGKLTLNRLVDNFFAEEEQSSFDPSTLVDGIGVTNDPVLQARLFAYRDTDYHRLGTGNINEIPVNRPIVETNTNNRDSYSKYRIDVDLVSYHENSLAGNTPAEVPPEKGGYVVYPDKVEGHITRDRPSESFYDYFSQARIFWNSLTPFEKKDLTNTFIFHLQSVKSKSVRQQNVNMWANVDKGMSDTIADNIGVERSDNTNVPISTCYPSLSMANTPHYAYTQKLAVLVGEGFKGEEVRRVLNTLQSKGVFVEIVSHRLGTLTGDDGTQLKVDETFLTKYPVLFDSIYIVGGKAENQEQFDQNLMEFYYEAYKHFKPIGVATTGERYVKKSPDNNLDGVVFAKGNSDFANEFVKAIAKQRFWDRT